MAFGENLRLAKHGDHGNRRGENDAVVDEIPETENPFQTRRSCGVSSRCFHSEPSPPVLLQI